MAAEADAGDEVFDRACYRCGAEADLVADENTEGLWTCRSCLERVAAQNELIRRGIEEEPDVET